MPATMSFKADVRQVERMLFGLEKKAVPKAARQSINRTIKTVQTRAVRQISRETSLQQKLMRRRMRIIQARGGRMLATLIAEAWSPNLASFNARQTKQGVRARVWGASKLHRGAFMANQGRTVFRRTSKKRLPIDALHGPSLRKHFLRRHINRAMREVAAERWPIEMQRALARQIKLINR